MAQANTKQTQLLKPYSITPMGAVERFVIADVIQVGKQVGSMEILEINHRFEKNFMDVIEENVAARDLPCHTLAVQSYEPPIIASLGGTLQELGAAAIALAHLFNVVRLGEQGPGIWDGGENICFALSPVDQKPCVIWWSTNGPGSNGIRISAKPASYPEFGLVPGTRMPDFGWSTRTRIFGG